MNDNFKAQEIHKVALSGFVNNSLELDKIIITLSVASVGGYITYIVKYLQLISKIDIVILLFISLSILFFLATSWIVLEIFKENRKYLQEILQGNYDDSPKLDKLDNLKDISFKLGIIFSLLFAIMTVVDKFNLNEMEDKLSKTTKSGGINFKGNDIKVNSSVNGLGSSMKPVNPKPTNSGNSNSNNQESKQSNDK